MTTDNEELADEITQVQGDLDVEQGLTQQPAPEQGITKADLEMMARSMQNQISGLQSRVDNGLNAIRRDSASWLQNSLGDLRGEIGRKNALADLDETQKPFAEFMLNEMDRRVPQAVAPSAQPTPQATTDASAQWEPVFQLVDAEGLSRNDPNIKYSVFSNTSLTASQQVSQFYSSLYQAKAAQAAARHVNTPTPQPAAANTVSPPNDSGRRAGGGAERNVDDVRERYLEGKYSSPEDPDGSKTFHAKMLSLGQTP
jgi:hypothetical protein